MRPRSLQARVVVATVVLFAVVGAAVAGVAALSLRTYLVAQLDTQVSRLARFAGDPPGGEQGPNGSGDRPPPPDAGGGFAGGPDRPQSTLDVRVAGGRIVSAELVGPRGSSETLPARDVAPAIAAAPGEDPRSVDLEGDLGDYRVAGTTTADGTTVVVGLPTANVDATVTRLLVIEAVVLGVGVLVAGGASAFTTRIALRPLRRVSATARRVSELPLERGEVDLAERVPDADADPRTEVGQVGASFNRMLGHVGGALAARQESETRVRRFVADASHELRTPLAAIRGYSELARRRADELPPEVAGMLDRVGSQTERMTLLVEDLLLLARLDAGRPLAREPVDLSRLVVDAVTDAHAAAPGHHWSLDLPESEVRVVGDPERLHQVVANLLANARTHTPPGTSVVAALSTGPGGACLEVRDDGPGIAPDLLPHVLERFARGDAGRARTTGSTGLGLAIVAAVVAEQGGSIDVTSVPGDTRITIRLPHP